MQMTLHLTYDDYNYDAISKNMKTDEHDIILKLTLQSIIFNSVPINMR